MDSISPKASESPVILEQLRRAEDGGVVRWPTRVLLSRDDSHLRIRFECRDGNRWATHTQRNAPLWQEEVVEAFIAPGAGTPRSYFEFEVNPLGALFEAVVHNPDSDRSTLSVDLSRHLSGIRWRAGSAEADSASPEDWWAELDLPWRSLLEGCGMEAEGIPKIWRINFFRVERPGGPDAASESRDEYSCWSPTLRSPADFHVPERFGYLILGPPDAPNGYDGSDHSLDLKPDGLPVIYLPEGKTHHAC